VGDRSCRLPDAFAALSVLAKSPHIDPKRIAVTGFSYGSTAALLSNVARFQKLYGSAELQFAAHVVVYGYCITNLRDDEDLTRPVLVLHGTADDVLPIEPCREYVARVSKAGKNIRLIEYAEAHHGFDELWARVAVKRSQGLNYIKCRLVEGDGGVLLSKETNQPFMLNDQCVGKGMTLHYHEAATKKVHEDVKAFLKEIFKQ
jgi:dienelactone hydrolase